MLSKHLLLGGVAGRQHSEEVQRREGTRRGPSACSLLHRSGDFTDLDRKQGVLHLPAPSRAPHPTLMLSTPLLWESSVRAIGSAAAKPPPSPTPEQTLLGRARGRRRHSPSPPEIAEPEVPGGARCFKQPRSVAGRLGAGCCSGFLTVRVGPGLALELLWSSFYCPIATTRWAPKATYCPPSIQTRGRQRQRGKRPRGVTQVPGPAGGKAGPDIQASRLPAQGFLLGTSPPTFPTPAGPHCSFRNVPLWQP